MTTASKQESAESPARFPLYGRLLMGAGAGAILAAGFPPYYLPIILPLGVATLLFALRGSGLRDSAYTGFVCGIVYFGGTLFWLGNLFGAAAVSLCAIAALFPTLFAVSVALLRGRVPIPDFLLAAICWTACEYFRSEPFVLNFGWVGLGYAMINFPAFARLAAWLGSYGITFLIVSMGGLLVPLTIRKISRRFVIQAGIVALVWVMLCVLPGKPPIPTNPLNVRLVQAFTDDTDSFFALSKVLPSEGIDAVVLPEYAFNEDPLRNPKLWQRIQQTAQQSHCFLIFGAKEIPDPTEDTRFRNTAFVLDPSGAIVGRHIKNHTVHFIRDGIAGKESTAISTRLGRLGVAICFDMDYPDVARRLAADGAEVFLVPNNDPAEWGQVQRGQHRLMFQMRAAECGRWLARADVAGGTSLVAPNGQEIARIQSAEPGKLDVVARRETGQTLYVRGGWRFGMACLWVLVGLVLKAVFDRIAKKRMVK